MNKYEVTLHTFCDACFSQATCKYPCRRMQEMEKLVKKYDKLSRAYDTVCRELSIGANAYSHNTKEEVKEMFLDDKYKPW